MICIRILIICLVLLLCNCDKNEQEVIPKINVFFEPEEVNDLNEVFSDFKLISLEGTVFRDPKQIVVSDKGIYLSAWRPKNVLVFGTDGKYVSDFGVEGKGPCEFSRIEGFEVGDTGIRSIISRQQKKLIKYKGDSCEEIIVPSYPSGMVELDDQRVLVYCVNENLHTSTKIILYNHVSKEIEHSFIPNEESRFLNIMERRNLFKDGDQIRFYYRFNDTIYEFENDIMKPWMVVDFKENHLPGRYLAGPYKDIQHFYETIRDTDYAFGATSFAEDDSYLLFNFEKEKDNFLAIYNKNVGACRTIHAIQDKLKNISIDGKNSTYFGPYGVTDDGYFIFYIGEEMRFKEEDSQVARLLLAKIQWS